MATSFANPQQNLMQNPMLMRMLQRMQQQRNTQPNQRQMGPRYPGLMNGQQPGVVAKPNYGQMSEAAIVDQPDTPTGGVTNPTGSTNPTDPNNPVSATPRQVNDNPWQTGGGYFPGNYPQPASPGTGQIQFPSPRSPYYNQNIGPALLNGGPQPNANYGQSWQNYSNPYDMMYNQYMQSQFGPQQQALWNQVGNNIGNFQNDYTNYKSIADAMYGYDNYGQNAYYTPEEQQNMIREQQLNAGVTGQGDYDMTFFSPEERQAILGDPYKAANYFDQKMAGAYGDQDTQEQRSFDALGEGDQNIRGIGDQYANYGQGALDSGSDSVRSAAYNPDLKAQTGELSLSEPFSKDYNFGQQDMTDLENLAGTTAGKHIQGQYEDIERKAAEQGNTSPMALAALKDRLMRESASESSDAATNARVQGRGLQLSTMANKEGMRLGAEQSKEGIRGQAAQNAAGLQTSAEQNLLGNKLGFGQSLAGLQSQNEQNLLGQRLNTYGQLGSQRQNLNQFGAGQGAQWQSYGDTAASNRAGNVASQRTTQQAQNNQNRFNQNYQTQGALAAGYGNVANQRLGANQEQRGYYTGQSGANLQALQNATNAGTNFWTNYSNTGQNAANSYGSYDLNRRQQQLQQQVANWNRQYQIGNAVANVGSAIYSGIQQGRQRSTP